MTPAFAQLPRSLGGPAPDHDVASILLTPYSVMVLAGLAASILTWTWLIRRRAVDRRLPVIYACGLVGALLGAKAAFLLAEGWRYWPDPVAILTGKSITGALLAGYLGVEIAKRLLDYRAPTGDLFALVVPLGIALGRVGCVLQGCCPGQPLPPAWWTVLDDHAVARWPAAHAELAFHILFLAWSILAAGRNWVPSNRFHVYLIAYGAFRFAHEFARDDARLLGPLTGYHAFAGALLILGAWGFVWRASRVRIGPCPEVGKL